jgi:catechol-2,3-dioxygenase
MRRLVRKKVRETRGEMCILKSGGNALELNWYAGAPIRKGNNLDHLAFEVQGIGKFRRLMRSLKGKKIRIHDYLATKSWDRFFIEDPDRNWIEIYARK